MTKYFHRLSIFFFPHADLWSLSTRIGFHGAPPGSPGLLLRLVSHWESKSSFIWKHFSSQHDHWDEEDHEGASPCLSTIIRSYFLSRCLYPTNLPYCIWKVCSIFFFFSIFLFGILSYLHSEITWKPKCTHIATIVLPLQPSKRRR